MAAWAFAAAGLGAEQGRCRRGDERLGVGVVGGPPAGRGRAGGGRPAPAEDAAAGRRRRRRTRSPSRVRPRRSPAGRRRRPGTRTVDQPDPVGDAADAERADRLHARTDDGRRQRHHDAVDRARLQHRGDDPPPPSTSREATPSERSRRSTSGIRSPSGPPATSRTITPVAASSRRRARSASGRHRMSVAASSDSTLAVSGVRRVESRTTRIGDAPGTIRTVSCGSSCSNVPRPHQHGVARRPAWRGRPGVRARR